MSARLEPTEQTADLRVWTVGGVSARASRHAGVWRYTRKDITVGVGRTPPEAALRLGRHEVVLHLATPLLLAPGAREKLWLALPLEVGVADGDGAEVDAFRPGQRVTMVGAVHQGRLLPALRCEQVAGPASLAGEQQAALAFEVVNGGYEQVLLRRAPVLESELTLAWHEGAFLAGTVQVQVHDAVRAEAHCAPLVLGEGAVVFDRPSPTRSSHAGTLDWLLDATRRSSEFRL